MQIDILVIAGWYALISSVFVAVASLSAVGIVVRLSWVDCVWELTKTAAVILIVGRLFGWW